MAAILAVRAPCTDGVAGDAEKMAGNENDINVPDGWWWSGYSGERYCSQLLNVPWNWQTLFVLRRDDASITRWCMAIGSIDGVNLTRRWEPAGITLLPVLTFKTRHDRREGHDQWLIGDDDDLVPRLASVTLAVCCVSFCSSSSLGDEQTLFRCIDLDWLLILWWYGVLTLVIIGGRLTRRYCQYQLRDANRLQYRASDDDDVYWLTWLMTPDYLITVQLIQAFNGAFWYEWQMARQQGRALTNDSLSSNQQAMMKANRRRAHDKTRQWANGSEPIATK